jgi:mono/diheme cytochrome c family protein
VLRGLAIAVACAAALAGSALAVAYAVAEGRVSRVYQVAVSPVPVRATADNLDRGRHLVEVVAQCGTCHGEDLGGMELADDLWLGRLWGTNLTAGRGGIADYTDTDLVRSIRHGVKRDGTPVLMMPAQNFYHLSDADLGAIIAWVRRLPPVDREAPPRRMGLFSAMAIATGQVPDLIPAAQLASRPPRLDATRPAASPDYGAYLVETGGCRVCHRQDLRGGRHPLSLPEEPPPADLTASGPLAQWSERDFVRALRTGVTPDGRRLDPQWMPWPAFAHMTDLEMRAIFLYLRSPSNG